MVEFRIMLESEINRHTIDNQMDMNRGDLARLTKHHLIVIVVRPTSKAHPTKLPGSQPKTGVDDKKILFN
jgi:hypothetical protein